MIIEIDRWSRIPISIALGCCLLMEWGFIRGIKAHPVAGGILGSIYLAIIIFLILILIPKRKRSG